MNGLCHTPHRWGYGLSGAKHAATTFNNVVVALFTGGEGLHHNHHWMQSSARFARAPLELLVQLRVVVYLGDEAVTFGSPRPSGTAAAVVSWASIARAILLYFRTL